MARIVENSTGGRRMIRLTGDDILMVVALVQREFRHAPATPDGLKRILTSRPFYLPEDSP